MLSLDLKRILCGLMSALCVVWLASCHSRARSKIEKTLVDPAACTVTVDPQVEVYADGSDSANVTVTLFDRGGNPVAFRAVQVTATVSDNSLEQTSLLTDELGVATATITSRRAETKTILAVVDPGDGPLLLPQNPTIRFVAPKQLGPAQK